MPCRRDRTGQLDRASLTLRHGPIHRLQPLPIRTPRLAPHDPLEIHRLRRPPPLILPQPLDPRLNIPHPAAGRRPFCAAAPHPHLPHRIPFRLIALPARRYQVANLRDKPGRSASLHQRAQMIPLARLVPAIRAPQVFRINLQDPQRLLNLLWRRRHHRNDRAYEGVRDRRFSRDQRRRRRHSKRRQQHLRADLIDDCLAHRRPPLPARARNVLPPAAVQSTSRAASPASTPHPSQNHPNSTRSIRRSPDSTLATQLCGTPISRPSSLSVHLHPRRRPHLPDPGILSSHVNSPFHGP
jgi:hypothetical protein